MCPGICIHRYSYFQDICPYRLPIGTPPIPLRELSKGPTVRAHTVGSSSTITQLPKRENKVQKSRKEKLHDDFVNALCIRTQLQAPQCTLQLISCKIGVLNHVKVTGFSCIPIGRSSHSDICLDAPYPLRSSAPS